MTKRNLALEVKCYSDASVCGVCAGYGVIVVQAGAVIARESGQFANGLIVPAAELMAMLRALSFVPDNVGGYSYSDLAEIVKMLTFECSYARKHGAIIDRLNSELERTKCVPQFVSRSKRSHHYAECHRLANTGRMKSRATLILGNTQTVNRQVFENRKKLFGDHGTGAGI